MGINIEIKARCNDPAFFKKQLALLSTEFEGEDIQVDTFFKAPNGRLKLRESQLYGNLLIPYLRTDKKGPKQSDYSLIKIEEVQKVKTLFSTILGVKGVLRKKRRIFLYENVRIHLDEVDHLGTFIEFEVVLTETDSKSAGRKKIDWLLNHFRIKQEDLLDRAYIELAGI